MKIFASLCATALALSLAACGDAGMETGAAPPEPGDGAEALVEPFDADASDDENPAYMGLDSGTNREESNAPPDGMTESDDVENPPL